jgi:hypothetical protein
MDLRSGTSIPSRLPLVAVLAVVAGLLAASPASAQTAPPPSGGSAPPPTATPTVAGAKAKLTKKGVAIAPANAPAAVVNAIAAGNAIRKMPYRYGGGHQSFFDSGYDCSGAVSYVLNGAGLLGSTTPLHSTLFMGWGEPGKGSWISVFAHKSHAYMVVAGLRFDTSAVGERFNRGSGPRWRATKRKPKGYVVRHPTGY